MNRQLLFLLLLLSSCGNSQHVITWSATNIIGAVLSLIILFIWCVCCVYQWLKSSVDRRDRSEENL